MEDHDRVIGGSSGGTNFTSPLTSHGSAVIQCCNQHGADAERHGPPGVDWPDIEAKYRALAPHAPIEVRKVESSLAAIRNLRTVADVAQLVEQLR
jgi:hypothetical protein